MPRARPKQNPGQTTAWGGEASLVGLRQRPRSEVWTGRGPGGSRSGARACELCRGAASPGSRRGTAASRSAAAVVWERVEPKGKGSRRRSSPRREDWGRRPFKGILSAVWTCGWSLDVLIKGVNHRRNDASDTNFKQCKDILMMKMLHGLCSLQEAGRWKFQELFHLEFSARVCMQGEHSHTDCMTKK